MSRAFVKETDDVGETLPERELSPHPNLVTAEGLAAIEREVERLHDAMLASDDDHRPALARDHRYWSARRATAQLVEPPKDRDEVRFGSTVTVLRDDARKQTFKLVGEDEADPERGTLAYVAPLARALMGKRAGETAQLSGADIEIVSIG